MLATPKAPASPFVPTPATLPLGGEQPRVAIGDDGQITAVWMHGVRNAGTGELAPVYDEEVAASTGSGLSGLWQEPVIVSLPGVSLLPEVAVDDVGDAAAVWLDSDPDKGTIDASYRPASTGAWQPPVAVWPPGERAADQHVLIEPDGDALAWWARLGEAVGERVSGYETAFRPAATGVWQSPRRFETGQHPTGLTFAVDGQGDLLAAWVSEGVVEAATLPSGSTTWETPVKVASAPPPGFGVGSVELAVSRGRNKALIWTEVDEQCRRGTFEGGSRCPLPITLRSSVWSVATATWSAPEEIPNAAGTEAGTTALAKIAAPAVKPLGDEIQRSRSTWRATRSRRGSSPKKPERGSRSRSVRPRRPRGGLRRRSRRGQAALPMSRTT